MTQFAVADEVRVDQPLRDYGDRWVFPGDRLFVKRVSDDRVLVYCPSSNTYAWLNAADVHEPKPTHDARALLDRVEHLERRVAELEDAAVEDQEEDDEEPPRGPSSLLVQVDEMADVLRVQRAVIAELEGLLVWAQAEGREEDAVRQRSGQPPYGQGREDEAMAWIACVRGRIAAHTPSEPAETAPEPSEMPEWRQNPHSLPPATREGVECPACSNQGQRLGGAMLRVATRHEDHETVDECVRRQVAMGWRES